MTIHGPGTPIYASQIQAEFGGGNPFYISNYYAGGPFVPAGTTGYFGAIPASGNITLGHFYNATKLGAWIDPSNISNTGNGSTGSVGIYYAYVNVGTPSSYNWWISNPVGATWGLLSANGGQSVQIGVNNVPSGATTTATIVCDMIVNGASVRATATGSFRRT